MKKITLTMLFGLFVAFSFAQTIVSTTPENKNAILEEYTGVQCTWCPEGHSVANSIKSSNPDDFFIINDHTGGYATPGGTANYLDFRTEVGAVIAYEANVPGYPTGSINRHVFSGSGSAMDRGNWNSTVNQVIAESSYVNIAVEADVDNATRILTVHVEAYYTADSPIASNFINVALLQNNTHAPQLDGGTVVPNYNHMHRLLDMVTGDWGFEVTTTTTGSFIDQTLTFEVPLDINGVSVDLDELELVAFVAETHQEVVTANGTTVVKINTPLNQNDVSLSKPYSIKDNCNGSVAPIIKVGNLGLNTVTSLDIDFSINGEATQSYTWSGNLVSLTSTDIVLPMTTFALQSSNTFTASITSSDDIMSNNGAVEREFYKAPESTENITVQIVTDNWGYELTWNIKDSDGTVVASGGGDGTNGSSGSYANNGNVSENYTLPTDCYTLEVNDSYGDGGNAIGIRNSDGDLITAIQGGYGSGDDTAFSTSDTAGTTNEEFSQINVYPNPSNGMVTLTEAEGMDINVFNVLGKEVFKSVILSNNESLDFSNLNSGVYLMNITNGEVKATRKLIIR